MGIASRPIHLPGIELEFDVRVVMRDGVKLATDIYRPPGNEPVPALVLRTPYGKGNVETEAYAHPAWYVRHGFAVVSQDVRGCWDSEGVFTPFASEADDGADTIAWAANQSWCDGAVGTFGFSYPGATQLLAASQSPHLKAMAPAMTGSSYCEGWTYREGLLNLAFVLSWAVGLGKAQATRAGDLPAVREFDLLMADPNTLYATLPVCEAIPPHLLEYLPSFSDWLEHRHYDEYWRRHSPLENYAAMQMPALHIAGWYDVFLDATIDNFVALRELGQAPQMLIVGPWYHMPWSQYVGELDTGEAGKNNIDEWQLRFFQRWLKHEPNGIDHEPAVHLFVLGANHWTTETEWPPARAKLRTFFLASDGRAASLNGTGRLQDTPPGASCPPDGFLADPRSPVLSLGGRSGSRADVTPMGAMDQRPQEVRNDILVFTSEPLEGDLTVAGYPDVTLHVASSVASSDFVVRVVDVHPDGRAINVSDGVHRLSHPSGQAEGVSTINIRLSAIANCFKCGHRIRLEVTGSSFPMHERNPHCAVDSLKATIFDLEMANQFVYHDQNHQSCLRVPVVQSSSPAAHNLSDQLAT